MEHPLLEVDPSLNLDQLQTQINNLTKKLTYAHRSGNGYLVGQIQMALESFNIRYQQKLQEINDAARKSGNDYSDRIDIS